MTFTSAEQHYLRGLSDAWFERVVVFNWRPSQWLHPSRVTQILGVAPEQWSVWLEHPRSARKLCALLSRRLRLNQSYHLDFVPLSHRSALLDAQTLERVAMICGLVLNVHSVTHSVLQATVGGVMNLTGEEGFRAALGLRARHEGLINPQMYTDATLLQAQIRADGWSCVTHWVSALPPALRWRVLLRLPAEVLNVRGASERRGLFFDVVQAHLPESIQDENQRISHD